MFLNQSFDDIILSESESERGFTSKQCKI